MGWHSRDPNRRLNIVISGWICIALGSGITLSQTTNFSLFLAVPMSIGGIALLIYGLAMDSGPEKPEFSLPEEE
tara:strand:+ start:131 stop:352 length:222 start_codon:yes stop_codon:yes gene_type:complete